MKSYMKRIADEMLQDCLESSGITVIQGPKWCAKIDTDRMYPPSFKMVLTGIGQYAYSRDDDVYIVPISSLKC